MLIQNSYICLSTPTFWCFMLLDNLQFKISCAHNKDFMLHLDKTQSKYLRCNSRTSVVAGLLTLNCVYSQNVNRNNRERVAPSQSLQLPALPEANRCPVLSCVASVHLSLLSGSFLTGVLNTIDLSCHCWRNHSSPVEQFAAVMCFIQRIPINWWTDGHRADLSHWVETEQLKQ